MLDINFEFRKGIFFIRLIGEMNKKNGKETEKIKKLILDNEFKYVVINTNYLNKVDIEGINYINEIFLTGMYSNSNIVICDKFNVIRKLINNNFPNIKEEIEVL